MSAATYLGCFLAYDRTTIDIAAQVCGRCRKSLRNRKKVGWSAFPTNGFPAELHRHAELTCSFSMSSSSSPCHPCIVILLAPSQPPALLLTHPNHTKMNSFASFVSALILLLAVSSTFCLAFAPSSSFTGGQANAVVRSTRQSSSSTNLSMIFGPKDDGSPGDYVCLGASTNLHLFF